MLVSYNWLQKYFDKKLPDPEKLADTINIHSFEVEAINKVEGDTVFDIKVTPDRAHYALCHRGVAFEINAITDYRVKDGVVEPVPVKEGVAIPRIKLGEPDKCLRYMARRIDNVSVGDSSEDVKKALTAVGGRSINSIVDAGNYVMFDVGQPLHVFDADKVKGDILIRSAYVDEKIILLDGTEVQLNENDLVIADEEGPLAIAGVKGGKKAEVTNETKNIIIESANFDSVTVRRTATRLNLRNESSKRFENNIVPELAEDAMHKITAMILDYSKSASVGPIADVFLKKTDSAQIKTSLSDLERMTGIKLSGHDLGAILTNSKIDFSHEGDNYVLYPPLGRVDLKIPEDIADEVVRIYGYDKLSHKMPPTLDDKFLPDKSFYWTEEIKNILIENGFSESLLYTLVDKGELEIAHPLAKDKRFLRESILPKLGEALLLNGNNVELLSDRTIKLFEIGRVFSEAGEKQVLAIGVFAKQSKKGMNSEEILYEALTDLDEKLHMKNQWKIEKKGNIAMLEIDLAPILEKMPNPLELKTLNFKSIPADKKYTKFSPYPFIVRDIALFVPHKTDEIDVEKLLKKEVLKASAYKNDSGDTESLLVKGPYCFDRFEKDNKKSFAFRMVFQSASRTLSDEEVNKIMGFVYTAAIDKEWEVR